MQQKTKEGLKQKGWSSASITAAEAIMESTHLHDKSRSYTHMNRVLYWTIILVIIIGNFLVSMVLVPFLLVINTFALDTVIVLLGFGFGALFNLLIRDVTHIEKSHHLVAAVLIPITSLINITLMIKIANAFNNVLQITTPREDTITISIIYIFAFSAPYLYYTLVKKE